MELYDGTEADAMDDSGYEVEIESPHNRYDCWGSRSRQPRRTTQVAVVGPTVRTTNIKYHYDANRAASVGETVKCPVCGTPFIKTTYHKVFCSNQKTVKHGSCKDKYNNMVTGR
jgi:hypothetical protein